MNIPSRSQIVSFVKKNRFTLTIVLILALVVGLILALLFFTKSSPALISAVSSIGLVIATAVSVITTSILLQEEHQSRKQRVKPKFNLQFRTMGMGSVGIVAVNIGNGPASDVEVDVKLEIKQSNGDEIVTRSDSITYPAVQPGDFVPIGNPFNNDDNNDDIDLTKPGSDYQKVVIHAEYKDLLGNERDSDDERVYKQNRAALLMTDDNVASEISDVSSRLKDIEKQIRDLDR